MEKKTHWKKTCNPNYLGSWDLDDGNGKFTNLTLTIKAIKEEDVLDPGQNKKTRETVCYFVENYKPMILNVTNKKAISKAAGSDYIEDWVGHKITIRVEKVPAFGDVWDALRVSPIPVEMKRCQHCGKEITVEFYNKSMEKYGVGVCCAKCLNAVLPPKEDTTDDAK